MATNAEIVETLGKLRPSSMFLVLHKYLNANNELANFNILFHISYKNSIERSITCLEQVMPESDLQARAKEELITSFRTSLESMSVTPVEDIDDAYDRFFDEDGRYIKGVKLHRETSILHLYGFVHQKVILEAGVYKHVNHRALTVEKDKLRKLCPASRFRQFKLTCNQVESISVEKMTILPPNLMFENL